MVKKGVVAKGKDEKGSSKDSVRNYCQFDDIDTILLSQPRTDSKPHFSSSASFTVHDMLSDFYSVVNICNFERDGLRCRSGSVNIIIVVVVVVIIIIKCTFI